MNTYYLAILIAAFILSSTLIITSWGVITIKLKMFLSKVGNKIGKLFFSIKHPSKKKMKPLIIEPEYIILKRK